MAQSLREAGLDLHLIGPLRNQYNLANITRYLSAKYLLHKNDHPQRDPGFLRHYARQVDIRLAGAPYDVVFAPGSLPIAFLRTDRPVAMWTDCTFANLLDYYPKFSNLTARSIRDGHDAERRALANCDLVLLSCQWAADSAVRDYGVDPDKIHIVPFGSNMRDEPASEAVERMIAARRESLRHKLSLLLIGVDWYRKGADVASAVTQALAGHGVEAELVVVGCVPPAHLPQPPGVHFAGFADKAKPDGVARLAGLLETAHFFILPSRADCTPVVFSEAAAWGLPCLATQTGGILSIIAEGCNGMTFPPAADPAAWGAAIAAVARDLDRYTALCRSSYQAYRQRLNWATSCRTVKYLLETMVQRRAVSALAA
ncbi:MAG: glycosyltransferase family 4 protein [Rhodopila sp.]